MTEKERLVRGYLTKRMRERAELQTDEAQAHFRKFWEWLRGKLPILSVTYAVRLLLFEMEEFMQGRKEVPAT